MESVSPCRGNPPLESWGKPLSQVLCVTWRCKEKTGNPPILALYLPNPEDEPSNVLLLNAMEDEDYRLFTMAYGGDFDSWHVYNP